jgi:hypothetical protein
MLRTTHQRGNNIFSTDYALCAFVTFARVNLEVAKAHRLILIRKSNNSGNHRADHFNSGRTQHFVDAPFYLLLRHRRSLASATQWNRWH